MKKILPFIALGCLLSTVFSCEKKYERPRKYEIDLFNNEKDQALQRYIMPRDVAYGTSDMVVASDDIYIYKTFNKEKKTFYIYSIDSGKLLFSKRDSAIAYPFDFLSTEKLKLNEGSQDSIYIFLEKLHGYRQTAEENNLQYQWLRNAPIYPLNQPEK